MPACRRLPRCSCLCGAPRVATCGGDVDDAEVQFQLASLLFDETRFTEALDAYRKAIDATDRGSRAARAHRHRPHRAAHRPVPGRPARGRVAARRCAPHNPEALSAYADALWSAGLFDEAEQSWRDALAHRAGVVARAARPGARARVAVEARRRAGRGAGGAQDCRRATASCTTPSARSSSACTATSRPRRPTPTTSTCCRTRIAATRRRGRGRRCAS